MAEMIPEGTVTLLFTDVEGSTALRTSQGDETGHARLQTHGELVRKQLQEHRGHEVKTMGDGFMAAFASARAAVDCAVGIQRSLDENNRSHPAEHHIRVRAGLHTGEVVREDGDFFGEAVNAAARIMAKAMGGQILVSETLRGVLGHGRDTELQDRGRFRLKGFPERWRLYEVLWRSKDEPAAAAAPVLAERTPFVGREAERVELRRLMEQAIAGHGSIVLIRGEPGVGKTRLAQEIVLEARARGMVDRTGRCYEMEGAPPYIPFIEQLQQAIRLTPADALRVALGENAGEVAKILPELRRIYDDIPPPLELPPEQERMYLFNSLRDFVERASSIAPLLLVVDDLHWADDATLLLFQHITQYQDKMRMLTIATYRDIELDVARPLARTLEWLLRQGTVHRIALKPLPEAGVEAMLQALTGQPPPAALVQAIYRETEGNPFFVEEVFQHLSEQGRLLDAGGHWRPDLKVSELDVPEGVRLVISRRLERVSEACRTALTDASVVGRDFTFELLETLSDMDSDALLDAIDEAERANLIVSPSEGPVLPEIPGVQEGTASPTEVMQAIAAQAGAPGAVPARPGEARFSFAHELIRQTLISGLSLPRRQRLHLRVAETMERVYGKHAELYAADMAHHLYQAGAAADPAKTARYLMLAGDQAIHGAAFANALRDFDRAFSLAPADDRAVRAELFYKRGLARHSLGRWDEAIEDWREAASAYEHLGNAEAAGRVFDDICHHLAWSLRYADVLEMSLRALAMLGRRDSAHRCRLLGWAGLMLSIGGYYSAGSGMIKRALAMAERLSDDLLLGKSIEALAVHHMVFLEVDKTIEFSLKAAEPLRRAGDLWYLVDTLWFAAGALMLTGRQTESLEVWREHSALSERLGGLDPRQFGFNAPVIANRLRTGDLDQDESHWQTAGEHALSIQDPVAILNTHVPLGAARFSKGRWQEALDSFEEAERREPGGTLLGYGRACVLLARAYMGDRGAALAILARTGQGTDQQARRAASVLLRAARGSGLGLTGVIGIIRESRSMQRRGLLPRPGRPNTQGSWTMLFAAVEALAILGEKAQAAKLYPLVLEAMKTGVLIRFCDGRLLDTVAGIAAGAGSKWTQAEEHFQTAVRRSEELPHVIEQPEARRWYAWMLLERNAPGDGEKACGLLEEAIEMYRRIGMPKHVEMAEAMLREAAAA